jgi:DNA-binding MarR family transcriptional regulator
VFVPAPLHRRVGAVLSWAAENAQEVANRALKPLGLTVKHFGVMTFLRHETEPDRERGALSQQAIGERLRIDRPTMVSLIDDLERAGYVKRERNPDDRRGYVITLTAAGKNAQTLGRGGVANAPLQFSGRLSVAERQPPREGGSRRCDDTCEPVPVPDVECLRHTVSGLGWCRRAPGDPDAGPGARRRPGRAHPLELPVSLYRRCPTPSWRSAYR